MKANDPRWPTLQQVFATLEQSGVRACVLHGDEEFPFALGHDVDALIDASATPQKLAEIFAKSPVKLIRQRGLFCVFQLETAPCVLAVDFQHQAAIGGHVLLNDILKTSIKSQGFPVPQAAQAFVWGVARSLSKGAMKEKRGQHLQQLFQNNTFACQQALLKIWKPQQANAIAAFAESGNWAGMLKDDALKSGLDAYLAQQPTVTAERNRLVSFVKGLINPSGFHLVTLGPDGAGKSSVVDTLEATMEGPFARVRVEGFAPPLYKLWAKGPIDTSTPHSHKMRSWPVSLLRAAYWFVLQTTNHVTYRILKARNTLILNDRYFDDILVDQKRYRYGGPIWALKMVKWVTPRPDAIILLSGDAAIIQARKKEVPVEVTARQLEAYRKLVTREKRHHIVDAVQPFDGVMRDVLAIVFKQR